MKEFIVSVLIALLMPKSGSAKTSDLDAAISFATLGDYVHVEHYFAIVDFLKRYPGTLDEMRAAQRSEIEAAKSKETLKPPSASVVESEFSHLLSAIQESNSLIGASVYNRFGLKVGAAGFQLETLILDKNTLQKVLQLKQDSHHLRTVTCEDLKVKLLASCSDPVYKISVSCQDIEKRAKSCDSSLYGVYRPISDSNKRPAIVGVSVVVFDRKFLDKFASATP